MNTMNYIDEEIIELKKIKRNQEYRDIRGDGIFIHDHLTRFVPNVIFEQLELYLPEDFIKMPDEFAALKYPSVNRPQKILTSLDGRTNFAFNLFTETSVPAEDVDKLAKKMKTMLQHSNPSLVFEWEESGVLSDSRLVEMFDYRSYGVDEKLYNMMCFASFPCGILHGIFNCLESEAEQWQGAAWQVFLSLRELEKAAN